MPYQRFLYAVVATKYATVLPDDMAIKYPSSTPNYGRCTDGLYISDWAFHTRTATPCTPGLHLDAVTLRCCSLLQT
jgi:hypothetical protein